MSVYLKLAHAYTNKLTKIDLYSEVCLITSLKKIKKIKKKQK